MAATARVIELNISNKLEYDKTHIEEIEIYFVTILAKLKN